MLFGSKDRVTVRIRFLVSAWLYVFILQSVVIVTLSRANIQTSSEFVPDSLSVKLIYCSIMLKTTISHIVKSGPCDSVDIFRIARSYTGWPKKVRVASGYRDITAFPITVSFSTSHYEESSLNRIKTVNEVRFLSIMITE